MRGVKKKKKDLKCPVINVA
uniref:Uncharacterized protein n=1 Tax=Anguilla anguilla TaxID=7936 RepID=A0A0E9VHB4_ANGAN